MLRIATKTKLTPEQVIKKAIYLKFDLPKGFAKALKRVGVGRRA